jgi:outer membrane immunogenic protein
MKGLFIWPGAIALGLSAQIALAADLPVRKAPAAVVAPSYSWSGCYGGVNAGWGWGNVKSEMFEGTVFVGSGKFGFDGGFVGAQLGCNVQSGAFVWGVEADIQKSWLEGSKSFLFVGPNTSTVTLDVPWFATYRLRGGFTNGPALFYLTAGGVAVEAEASATLNAFQGATASDTLNGWTIGAGYEAMLSPQWTWKIEYLYVRMKDQTTPVLGPVFVDHRAHAHLVRVGLNYLFGPRS